MALSKTVPEEFLHYVWEQMLFFHEGARTVDGEPVQVVSPGVKNSDSGPDFFDARIRIDDTVWAGNVEIHPKASDWIRHNHHQDKSYDNVVLHAVEVADSQIVRSNGEKVPTLVLEYPEQYRRNYQKLLDSKSWIACQDQFFRITPQELQLYYSKWLNERLVIKTREIAQRMEVNKDWNETFYQLLARMFGFKVNALPFELLTRALPLHILLKHKNSLFQMEALLFGTSGLLNEQLLGDDYYLELRNEYSFLYRKYQLRPLEAHIWKFMRLRPVNFPTLRIAQLASLICNTEGLFSRIMEMASLDEMKKLFHARSSSYWDTHYRFNKPSASSETHELGETAVHMLIINVAVPFMMVYANLMNKDYLRERALEFLQELPPEDNSIIRKWKELGIEAHCAYETQALLQLKNMYCDRKKCLYCRIGSNLVKALPA